MHFLVENLKSFFSQHSNAEYAVGMKKYMKDKFLFCGIKKPLRAELQKNVFPKANQLDLTEVYEITKELWELDEREYQYAALDLLDKYKKNQSESIINLYEHFIISKSWWDTVDILAAKLVGSFFMKYPDLQAEYIKKWMKTDNFWLHRTCLLFQLKYKEHTNTDLLTKTILSLSMSKEFFIQKAIGWILREYSKTNSIWVENFVEQNDLSNLSKREALKWLKKNQ